MAKQMVCAAPGVLQRLMALRKVTQSELGSQIGVDVKTLRSVNRGELVKDTTLKRIALKLGVPVEHLLTDIAATKGTEQTHDGDSAELDARDQVVLKPTTSVILKELLEESEEIEWSLDLPALHPQERDQLLQFEGLVRDWYRQLRNARQYGGSGSLSVQIQRLETATEINNHIKSLSEMHKIGVFSGQYCRWERTELTDPYEDQLCRLIFKSSPITIIALRPASVTTTTLCVDRGELPPKRIDKVPVAVEINGHEVWDGRRFKSFPEPNDYSDTEMEM